MPNTCDTTKQPRTLLRSLKTNLVDRKDCRMYYSFDLGPVHFLMLAGEGALNNADFSGVCAAA